MCDGDCDAMYDAMRSSGCGGWAEGHEFSEAEREHNAQEAGRSDAERQ